MDKALNEANHQQYEMIDDVASVVLGAEVSENKRRIVEENSRLDRYETLQVEAVTAGRRNAAIEIKWKDIVSLKIPELLAEQLEVQVKSCQATIDGKDRRIRDFEVELQLKNERFVSDLNAIGQNVALMSEKMKKHSKAQREMNRQQIKVVVEYFEQERKKKLATHKEELDTLVEKRCQMEETEFNEKRQDREKRYVEKIELMRTENANDFNGSKIALERSKQELEQHLEKIMATYQLNKEKLDYNLQVLVERNKEHSAIMASYKSKLNRLREAKNLQFTRYQAADLQFKEENTKLTESYHNLTRKYKEVQQKSRHLEEYDEAKFRQVWSTNEAEARNLISKVLEGNKLIHEQILGIEWLPPSSEQIQIDFDAAFEDGGVLCKYSALDQSENESGTIAAGTCCVSVPLASVTGKFSVCKVKRVLDLVRDECKFLLDSGVKTSCANLPSDQKGVVEIDAVLRYIGVEHQDDLDLLVSRFYQGQDEDDETLLVDADDVLTLIADFMTEKENIRIADVSPDKKKKKKRQSRKKPEQ